MFGAGATERFVRAVEAKTGLRGQGDRFVGQFQGLPVWSQTQMVGNHAGALRGDGGLFGGLAGLLGGAGGMAQAMTGGAFFLQHDYVVELPQNQLPGGSLREHTSVFRDHTWQQRPPAGPRVSSGVPWIDQRYEVASPDPRFMAWVCASPELQQHLPRWPQLHLIWEPARVWLQLVDAPARIHAHFGTEAQQNGDMILQGLWLVAAAARATFAR